MAYKRNLLIVLAHGFRSDAIGDAQAWPLSTPNLEKLAGRGLRLAATSACPADCGGLVSLFTGLHARQHGYVNQTVTNITCEGWPTQLVDQGYHVAGVGCVAPIEPWLHEAVHVEDVERIDAVGCSYLDSTRKSGNFNAITQQRKQRQRYGPFEPDRLLLEPQDDIDGYIARAAETTLKRMPKDKPWALIVVFNGPGNDLPPPTLYDQMIDPRALEVGFRLADFRELNDLAELDYPRVLLQRMEPHKLARIRSDYLGRVSLIDYAVGRLQEAMWSRDDRDRTWTVFSSDRGHLLGDHGLVGHRSFLTAALEVPVVIASPTAVKLHTTPGLVSTVDVAATIAALAGCDLPEAAGGRSLMHVLRGEPLGMPRGNACLSEFGGRLMLETEQYKVIFEVETGTALGLYDLLHDPDEEKNLVHTVTACNVLDSLRVRLSQTLLMMRAMPS
ncbi:MAG: sulfatase-like hydrolase/transferase [Phycisphaeraceae bacterium]